MAGWPRHVPAELRSAGGFRMTASELVTIQPLADLCLFVAALGCGYLIVSAALVLWFPAPMPQLRGWHVPVSILKPLCGDEPGLLDRLVGLCLQDYGAPVQLVLGVQDPADPAIAVVRRLQREFPDSRIELRVDQRRHGTNRKVSNLINMMPLADGDIVVLADSDIEVGPRYLADIVAELQRSGVGAVTCLYHGTAATGLWARLAAASVNAHFLPNVISAVSIGLARPCFGSTIALRCETLAAIGGFEPFADCLADDYAIGEAVRAVGLEVAIPGFAVGHTSAVATARELVSHELRWARTIRSIDPVGYAGSVIAHPFPFALLAVVAGSERGLILAAIATICRMVLCACVERRLRVPVQSRWLLPVCDLLSFVVLVWGLLGADVSWRGQRYRIASGALVEEPDMPIRWDDRRADSSLP